MFGSLIPSGFRITISHLTLGENARDVDLHTGCLNIGTPKPILVEMGREGQPMKALSTGPGSMPRLRLRGHGAQT